MVHVTATVAGGGQRLDRDGSPSGHDRDQRCATCACRVVNVDTVP